jgi:hypothetical protein
MITSTSFDHRMWLQFNTNYLTSVDMVTVPTGSNPPTYTWQAMAHKSCKEDSRKGGKMLAMVRPSRPLTAPA